MSKNKEPKIALFIDFDNIAIGLREAGAQDFDITRVNQRILEKGRIIYKRAYGDWNAFRDAKISLHEGGVELIDIPFRRNIGKNSADIRLVVDALDLCYTKDHIDTFIIGSGDSDFSPLVSKLKENDKKVIGFGLRESTSNLLVENCDEFIFYEDIVKVPSGRPPLPQGLPKGRNDAFTMVLDAVGGLIRENKDVLYGSLIKDTIQRKQPSFNESTYGYASFTQLLEDAAQFGLLGLIKDPQSGGTTVVTGFGSYAGGSKLMNPTAPIKPGVIPNSPHNRATASLAVSRSGPLHQMPLTSQEPEVKQHVKMERVQPQRVSSRPPVVEEVKAPNTSNAPELVKRESARSESVQSRTRADFSGQKSDPVNKIKMESSLKVMKDAPQKSHEKASDKTEDLKKSEEKTKDHLDLSINQVSKPSLVTEATPEVKPLKNLGLVAEPEETYRAPLKEPAPKRESGELSGKNEVKDVSLALDKKPGMPDFGSLSIDSMATVKKQENIDSEEKDSEDVLYDIDVKKDEKNDIAKDDVTVDENKVDEADNADSVDEKAVLPKGEPLRSRVRIRRR